LKDETALAAVAMVCIMVMLACALFLGYNGALLATGLSLIAGLAGYEIGKRQETRTIREIPETDLDS